jgi:hypothetical protein
MTGYTDYVDTKDMQSSPVRILEKLCVSALSLKTLNIDMLKSVPPEKIKSLCAAMQDMVTKESHTSKTTISKTSKGHIDWRSFIPQCGISCMPKTSVPPLYQLVAQILLNWNSCGFTELNEKFELTKFVLQQVGFPEARVLGICCDNDTRITQYCMKQDDNYQKYCKPITLSVYFATELGNTTRILLFDQQDAVECFTQVRPAFLAPQPITLTGTSLAYNEVMKKRANSICTKRMCLPHIENFIKKRKLSNKALMTRTSQAPVHFTALTFDRTKQDEAPPAYAMS